MILKYPYSEVFLTASDVVENSISYGRSKAKNLLSRKLLGNKITTQSSTVIIDQVESEPPSITQIRSGVNHYYVSPAISSSLYEQRVLNAFNSGTIPLETTAVPATGNLFYSKKQNLQTVTYKYKITSADTGFDALLGAMVSSSQGVDSPRTFTLNVNETGKLVNLRVWVELVHKSSSGFASMPLEDTAISIRSPNLSFGHAHPIRNDKRYKAWSTFAAPENFYRDSFVLWEGPSFTGDSYFNAAFGYTRERYCTWGKDRCMRVVFDDASPNLNPRHLRNSPASTNTNGAPHTSDNLPGGLQVATGSGNNVPWFSEPAIVGTGSFYSGSGSPPAGWLSGPGGVAASNEWPTTGSNYGAETIKPLYPFLDDIFQRKIETGSHTNGIGASSYGDFLTAGGSGSKVWTDAATWSGFRPGLKGTEISGSWQIMFARGTPADTAQQMEAYVRQVRLEITFERNRNSFSRNKSKSDLLSPIPPGKRILSIISGTDAARLGASTSPDQDFYKNEIYTIVKENNSIGRTFGILTNSSSLEKGDFALYYSVTGNLSSVSGANPWWLISSEFGTPQIPISSSSLGPYGSAIERNNTIDELNPTSNISDKSLISIANSTNKQRKLAEIAAGFTGSST